MLTDILKKVCTVVIWVNSALHPTMHWHRAPQAPAILE